jgi:phosphoserine phosphatase RsbU/P
MMNETKTRSEILEKILPERLYSSSVLRIARHPWSANAASRVLELADELQRRPEIAVIGIVDDGGRALGIVRRDRLFALIGKPFGREVLQRSLLREVMEAAPTFHAHADFFAVAQDLRSIEQPRRGGPAYQERQAGSDMAVSFAGEGEAGPAYFPLVDDKGKLQGILAGQDLANYLARVTQDDIELAGQLQERLLAGAELPDTGRYRLEAWSRSAKGVGGDFYFGREIAPGRVFAALCDVSGKGVAASLIVSLVWGILRGYDFRRGLRELLTSLNRAIVATFQLEKYLTGFFMIYDQASGRLVYADMGHSHVLVLREGRAHALRSPRMNLPVGIEGEIDPAIQMVRLREGDSLFAYSDGIVEQENTEGVEFGDRALVRVLLSAGLSSDGLPSEGQSMRKGGLQVALPAAIDAYRAGTPQQDDMSFLLLSIGAGETEDSAGS